VKGGNPSSLLMQADCSGHIHTVWPIFFVSSQRPCYCSMARSSNY